MILNILRNFFKKSNYLVIIKKLLKRFEKDNHESSIKWAKKQTNQTIDELMQKIDFKLYLKSKKNVKSSEMMLKKFFQILMKICQVVQLLNCCIF
tara:strand:+ start:546 stop:830 length:285 start_codon:yes stop_codon:yes gene_type:complete